MLDSLDIKNYRNLKELSLNSLGRVNLITGKNNTGKSSLLEAISIYATNGNQDLILQILEERGEKIRFYNKNDETSENHIQTNIKTLSSLFNNRVVGFDIKNAISIGCAENNISLRFVKYTNESIKDEQGNIIKKRIIFQDNSETKENYIIGFEIKVGDSIAISSLENDELVRALYNSKYFNNKNTKNIQIVKTRNLDKDINSNLFDKIALTDKEQNVINALKIIEPLTERIAFIEENRRERSAVIKLSGSQNILPLQSMGDGINRILTIILALVNAESGYLLIDEFENGLHYSVQENLWKIIFQLSKELNIQVFATTHSKDCIKSFQSILNNQENLSDGKLIRLDNQNGIIKQVEFDAKELKIADEQDIEIR